uniref:Uncharacterized protein n=1 Tax=Strongyloides papillosus TaxID=174720 RepID=A0A0N5C691_STREA
MVMTVSTTFAFGEEKLKDFASFFKYELGELKAIFRKYCKISNRLRAVSLRSDLKLKDGKIPKDLKTTYPMEDNAELLKLHILGEPETLASVVRNTSLSIDDLELKIKTIFENIDWKSSGQLKPLIPKKLNLQINFKPKPWTSRFMDRLKNFGKKDKSFFTGGHKNETNTQGQEVVKVFNEEPTNTKV